MGENVVPPGTSRGHGKINSSIYSLSDSLFRCVNSIIPLSLSFSDRNLLVILQRFALIPFLKLQKLEDLRRKGKKRSKLPLYVPRPSASNFYQACVMKYEAGKIKKEKKRKNKEPIHHPLRLLLIKSHPSRSW